MRPPPRRPTSRPCRSSSRPLRRRAPRVGPSAERLLVDGGVYANAPTVAAIAEALKRQGDEPAALRPHELLVVSVGNGHHEVPYPNAVRWGGLGWILPRGGESPLLSAFLDGESDAADHWAHMLVNHEPGAPAPRPRGGRLGATLLPLPDLARSRAGARRRSARQPEGVGSGGGRADRGARRSTRRGRRRARRSPAAPGRQLSGDQAASAAEARRGAVTGARQAKRSQT